MQLVKQFDVAWSGACSDVVYTILVIFVITNIHECFPVFRMKVRCFVCKFKGSQMILQVIMTREHGISECDMHGLNCLVICL